MVCSKEMSKAILRTDLAHLSHSSCVFQTKVSSTYLMMFGHSGSGHTISPAVGLCLSYRCSKSKLGLTDLSSHNLAAYTDFLRLFSPVMGLFMLEKHRPYGRDG
jgi:hypothetical protein